MDILTEVVDALQLKATGVKRLVENAGDRETLRDGEAAIVVAAGPCAARTVGGDLRLVADDCVLFVGRQELELTGDASAPAPLRCRYSLQTALPHPLARQLPPVLALSARLVTDNAELGRAVSMLDGELANTRFGSEFVTVRLAEIVFVEVLRKCQLEEQGAPSFLSALTDPSIRKSLELIHGSPNKAWRVDDLANGAGLSRGAFTERFHKRVGEPPLRYLRAWRLLNARRDLAGGFSPIRDVAENAGYRSANGFSRAFRRFFGQPPSALRRRAS
jgi:AraC-like DNA-binding protein